MHACETEIKSGCVAHLSLGSYCVERVLPNVELPAEQHGGQRHVLLVVVISGNSEIELSTEYCCREACYSRLIRGTV